MKYVKLNCTYGGVKNPTLQIGEAISLEEATALVAEGLGKPYTPDGLSGTDARVEELEGEIAELNEHISELKARNVELEGQLALLSPAPVVPPKTGGK